MDNKAIGFRLKQTREALGFKTHGDQKAFAKNLGLKPVAYNQYEAGDRALPPAIAARLYRLYGVPFAWLYQGEVKDLPAKLDSLRRL